MKYFEPIFDTTMNLELAINYLKNNNTIHPIHWQGDGTSDVNEYKVQIFYSKYDKEKVPKKEFKNQIDFIKLADLIEKEGELLSQLEFLLRDIPMEDVKKFDLELIKQSFIYYSLYQDTVPAFDGVIVMSDKSPLASLGCIVYSKHPVTVIASMKTAMICSAFIDVCKQAGLEDLVNLCIVSNIDDVLKENISSNQELMVCLDNVKDVNSGCIGIVTGKADIDSAVDTFLFASDQHQWRVRTIFVQENVINNFKNALKWKSSQPTNNIEIQKASSNVYQYENKLFVYEFVGDSKTIVNATTIETYRTIKEVITLLKNKKSMFASVWSNDIAESNEIAHNIASDIVWINGYGHIDNPQTANAFYSIIHRYHNRLYNDYLFTSNNIESINKKMNAWVKLGKRARLEIITNWLRELKSDNLYDVYGKRLVADDSDSSVSVGQQMCISMKKPVDFIVMDIDDSTDVFNNERLLKFLVNGGGIVFTQLPSRNHYTEETLNKDCHIDFVEKAIFINTLSCNIVSYWYEQYLLYTNKVIWSSIGTVFAN